jgi:hypothetical protein
MQRHGGRTRPADEPAAKAAPIATPENVRDDHSDAPAGTAPDKPSESKD